MPDPDALPASAAVASHDLHRQGDLLHPAGRGQPTPAGRRSSAASPAATSGAGARRIARRAICTFCDTDFVGTDGPDGGKFRTADELADAVAERWPSRERPRPAVRRLHRRRAAAADSTRPLIAALHAAGFEIAVETNGTLEPPAGIDWICVSPKAGSETVLRRGNELKLVYPQHGAAARALRRDADFEQFYLQPMDGPDLDAQHRSSRSSTASRTRSGAQLKHVRRPHKTSTSAIPSSSRRRWRSSRSSPSRPHTASRTFPTATSAAGSTGTPSGSRCTSRRPVDPRAAG